MHVERSAFQTLYVVDGPERRCLRFTNDAAALDQSCVRRAEPDRLEFRYTRAMVAMTLLWQPAPRRVLMIGLGGGSIARALALLRPDMEIDIVEIDPAVVSVAQRFFGFAADAKRRVHAQDARDYVRAAAARGEQFDAVLLDAFDENGIPPALYTAEFLAGLRQLLAPQGVFLANTFAGSSQHAQESEATQAAFGAFLDLRVAPGAAGNRLIIASPSPLPPSAELLARREALGELAVRVGIDDATLREWRFEPPAPQTSSPTSAAVRQVVSRPASTDFRPSAAISARRSAGSMAFSPPSMIPRLPKLANPQSA